IIIDVNEYLKNPEKVEIPVLKPDDIIIIPRSLRANWNVIIQVISQIAIILNVIYLINKS
ncbi:MAG: hypothetical protein ACTSVV_16950, partial [Promethearchaeota archaeon]